MIGVHRVTGRTKLYGSALDHHDSFLTVSIRRCTRHSDTGRDWHHGGEELIEVAMSHAQFAEMITTPNMGFGVPCTLQRVDGAHVPGIPDTVRTEAAEVISEFNVRQQSFVDQLHKLAEEVHTLLAKPRIGVRDKEVIGAIVTEVVQEVETNRPFAVQQFQEAAEKVVTQAKAEIDATLAGMLRQAGVQKLKELRQLQEGLDGDKKLPEGS